MERPTLLSSFQLEIAWYTRAAQFACGCLLTSVESPVPLSYLAFLEASKEKVGCWAEP